MESINPLIIFILVFAIGFVIMAVKNVNQGMNYTVERFGKYTKTLEPGFHTIVPIFDRIGYKINMKETVLDVPSQDVITRDNATARIDAVVYYQVLDAAKAAYEVNNMEFAILNLTMTNIRTVLGSMELDESLSSRDQINAKLMSVVDDATNSWGVKVTRIEIRDIEPPHDIKESMSRQMKAERNKRADILDAEADRQAAIERAEGEKRAQILESEGRKEAAYRDAEARERSAEAEAKATQMVSEAIAAGNINAINYFVAQKYVEALKDIASAPNQKTFFMPLEASNLIGAIGGIAEIAKDAMGSQKSSGSVDGSGHGGKKGSVPSTNS